MHTTDNHSRAILTLAFYWGSILLGMILPWLLLLAFEISAHQRTLAQAFAYVRLHFFTPGYNFFLIGILNAVPFMIFSVFLLFHLGRTPVQEPAFFSRRMAGVLGALLLMFGVSFWTHVTTLVHPDAQGALAYLFLPLVLTVLMPLGYAGGRLVGKLWIR